VCEGDAIKARQRRAYGGRPVQRGVQVIADNSQVGTDDLFHDLVGGDPATRGLAADESERFGLQLDGVRARCMSEILRAAFG
jgi:hypothetical protein